MKKTRVAFELSIDLHNKLIDLCKKNNFGISEYLRGLIIKEYDNQTSNSITNDTNEILEILKQIEINTRK
jgi:hypothetical protein